MGLAPSLDAVARHSPVRALPPPAKVAEAFRDHELFVRASAVAFRVLLTLIPFAMFVLALAGALSLSSLWSDDIVPNLAPHVSAPVFQIVDSTVQKALAGRQLYWVTIGFALALWESSAAVRAIMSAFDAIYRVGGERTTRARLLVSAWLALAEGALVLATAAVLRGGPHVLDGPLGAIARYLVAAALLWVAV